MNVQLDAMMTTLISYWWLTLPLAIFLLFGHRLAPRVIITAFGFYVGLTIVVPILKDFEAYNRLVQEKPGLEAGISLIVGVVVAALLYTVYATAITVLGFLGGGLLGLGVWYALGVMIPDILESIPISPNYMRLIFFGVFGAIGAIVATTKRESVSSALAMITGAGGLALLSVGAIQLKILKHEAVEMTPLYNFIMLAVFVLLLLIVYAIFDRKRPGKEKEKA